MFLGLVPPLSAHAGIFSDIIKLFSGEEEAAPESAAYASISIPLLGSGQGVQGQTLAVGGPIVEDTFFPLSSTLDSALISSKNPAGTLPSSQHGQILIYTVLPGDTPGSVAENFGISLNTLLWANNIRNSNLIKVGDELVILPVSGVRYDVKSGDTLESIAKKFKGDVLEISSFNGLALGEKIQEGSSIIIPDGELAISHAPTTPPSTRSRVAGLPEHRGYYMRPIFGGRRSRGIHGFNGVDLADSCGLPVLASAEGTVIIARSSGWNGGYGRYLVISHPNGTQTLYAHLSAILSKAGQTIDRGFPIATIGSTGNSTGCHVHFEIRGAKNPF